MIGRAFQSTLLILNKGCTLLANVRVISVSAAAFAKAVARPANCFSGKTFQLLLRNLRSNILIEGSVRTCLLLLETLNNFEVAVDQCFVTRDTSVWAELVLGPVAAADAVGVTGHALAQSAVVVFAHWPLLDAERPVLGVLAFGALISTLSRAWAITFFVTLHALPIT